MVIPPVTLKMCFTRLSTWFVGCHSSVQVIEVGIYQTCQMQKSKQYHAPTCGNVYTCRIEMLKLTFCIYIQCYNGKNNKVKGSIIDIVWQNKSRRLCLISLRMGMHPTQIHIYLVHQGFPFITGIFSGYFWQQNYPAILIKTDQILIHKSYIPFIKLV